MKEIILRAKELSAGYAGAAVVRDVSFSVAPGEIVSLIGPNGAGKTTLLRTMARQLRPLAGTVLLEKEELWSLDERTAAQKLALLGTERPRLERMTAGDAVRLGRYPYTGRLGLLSEADERAAAAAMERVGVAELAERELHTLSDGQRQRVLLARALCQEPEVLVLDEPTAYLDVRYQAELLTLLRTLAAGGVAVVLSLHEPELARRVSDTVLCVRNGALDRAGPPAEVLSGGYLEELYGMEPGSWNAFFGRGTDGDSGFFQNRSCDRFPCHRGVRESEFNCLFCYCPLYALGERCGGNCHYTEKGVKSCVDCAFPHERGNYRALLSRFPELAALAREERT